MLKGYHTRKIGKRNPLRIIVIVCEGRKTEPMYFNRYRQRNSGLKIETLNSGDTDPKSLVEFALRQVNRYDLDLESGDQVWCVFDVDHNNEESLMEAKRIAGNQVNIALSNPCFELWYLLHFHYSDAPHSTGDVIRELKSHIQTYDKTKDCFDLLLTKRTSAIKNANLLKKKHIQKGIELISLKSNPSTQVCDLVDYILDVINKNKP